MTKLALAFAGATKFSGVLHNRINYCTVEYEDLCEIPTQHSENQMTSKKHNMVLLFWIRQEPN